MKKKIIIVLVIILIFLIITYVLNLFNYIPHKMYSNEDFNIKTYISKIDKDEDGIDDQTDILNNVREYISTKPKYKSKYYANGYPDDGYGVCTDVVAFGLNNAGYDLMQLVNEDIENNRDKYNIETVDKRIGKPKLEDRQNKKGITFVIHHANPFQKNYEEDILKLRHDIVGHYRIS